MLALLLACTSATEVPVGGADTGVPGAEAIPGVPEPEEVDPTDAVFDPAVIHDVALTMAPAAWADTRDNPWA